MSKRKLSETVTSADNLDEIVDNAENYTESQKVKKLLSFHNFLHELNISKSFCVVDDHIASLHERSKEVVRKI